MKLRMHKSEVDLLIDKTKKLKINLNPNIKENELEKEKIYKNPY